MRPILTLEGGEERRVLPRAACLPQTPMCSALWRGGEHGRGPVGADRDQTDCASIEGK